MTTAKKISGVLLAAAAAGMFATMPVAHAAKHEGKVMCEGALMTDVTQLTWLATKTTFHLAGR